MQDKLTTSPSPETITKLNDFVRGFVATGLISAVGRREKGNALHLDKTILKHALQGGAALTAAVSAAHAAQRRDYSTLLLSLAVGAASVYTIDYILSPTAQTAEKE